MTRGTAFLLAFALVGTGTIGIALWWVNSVIGLANAAYLMIGVAIMAI